jgi:ABC-2 type transport system permease protein
MGAVNWLGLWTLYVKEVRRFAKVATQTIVAPTVTTLLFLVIFALAFGARAEAVAGVPFLEFLVPGLAVMAMVQNAFANTASSLVIAKVQGNVVDMLMPPLSPGELAAALAGGGMTRGIIVVTAVLPAMALFVPLTVHHAGFIVFHAVAASLMMSLLGLIGGIWAEKFDHMAAITNFVVTPLSFLSGTFYSVERLPPAWDFIARLNPFFYMIDGFRYGFIGHADGSLVAGVLVMVGANAALWWIAHRMIARGYKLKT